MSSSRRIGARGKAVAAKRRVAPTPVVSDDIPDGRNSDGAADPWFTPGPKRTAAPAADFSDEALRPPADNDRPRRIASGLDNGLPRGRRASHGQPACPSRGGQLTALGGRFGQPGSPHAA